MKLPYLKIGRLLCAFGIHKTELEFQTIHSEDIKIKYPVPVCTRCGKKTRNFPYMGDALLDPPIPPKGLETFTPVLLDWSEIVSLNDRRFNKWQVDNKFDYNLFIPDYHNGFEKEYVWLRVTEGLFNKDWSSICDSIPASRIRGLGNVNLQEYFHFKGWTYILYHTSMKEEQVNKYTSVNSERSKVVKHNNIGNY
jgi:hypothetical protein